MASGPFVEIKALTAPCPLSIEKSEANLTVDYDGSGTPSLGDMLSYTVSVTNTSQATQNNIVVSDPLLTPSSITCSVLAAGQSCVLTGSYIIDSTDVEFSKIINTGTGLSDENPDLSLIHI